MEERALLHICEVCDRRETLTPAEAFDAGWDYPPRMGHFGVISARTCGGCLMTETVWWAVAMEGKKSADLTAKQLAVVERISAEPESIMPGAAP